MAAVVAMSQPPQPPQPHPPQPGLGEQGAEEDTPVDESSAQHDALAAHRGQFDELVAAYLGKKVDGGGNNHHVLLTAEKYEQIMKALTSAEPPRANADERKHWR